MKITKKTTNDVIDWILNSGAVSNTNQEFTDMVNTAHELREEHQTITAWKKT